MMQCDFFYKYAIVCKSIPNSITNGLSLHEHDGVNVENARIEHKNYLNCLKDAGLELIEVEENEIYPDCVFVEDTAVIINQKIFITNPGAISRRGEIDAIRNAIEKFINDNKFSNYEIGMIKNKNEAFVDGGDCCFTGRQLLVGISSRTNQKGAEELAAFFSDIPVIEIKVNDTLHLKSVLTMLNYNTIIIGNSINSKFIRDQMNKLFNKNCQYELIEVENDEAANVLFINNKLFVPSSYKHVFENNEKFKNIELCALSNTEFAKIDGCLTCRSVLFN